MRIIERKSITKIIYNKRQENTEQEYMQKSNEKQRGKGTTLWLN
jgi:hypothetical protein